MFPSLWVWGALAIITIIVVVSLRKLRAAHEKEEQELDDMFNEPPDIRALVAGEEAMRPDLIIIDEASDVTDEQWNRPTRKPIKERRQKSRPRKGKES